MSLTYFELTEIGSSALIQIHWRYENDIVVAEGHLSCAFSRVSFKIPVAGERCNLTGEYKFETGSMSEWKIVIGYQTWAGEFCVTNREFSGLRCLLNTLIQSRILMRETSLFLTFSPWNIICIRSVYMWAGSILEIGQWGSNGPPSLIFDKKGGPRKGAPNPKTECFLRLLTFYMGCTCQMFRHHFGTFWATEKVWAKITAIAGCLSGEIMTQTKKRKAIETVKGYKSSK